MQATKLADAEKSLPGSGEARAQRSAQHIALAICTFSSISRARAQIEFMKVLETDPKNAATHIALGNLYADQNQLGLAENQFRAAVALEPDRPNYHLDLGEILRKEGKTSPSEDQIRTAIGLNPKDAQAHLALANLLASSPGRAVEANAEFDQVRALRLQADYPRRRSRGTSPGDRWRDDCVHDASGRRAQDKAAQQAFVLTKNSPVYQSPDETSFHNRRSAPQEVCST